MKAYLVKQGDYLSKLASAMGFDAEAVWNDAANRALRERRADPQMLSPGDVLQLPAKPTAPPLSLKVGGVNRLVARLPRARVSVVFREGGAALAGERYVIEGLTKPLTGSADSDGKVTIEGPLHVRELRVVFPAKNLAFPVRIGDLDPEQEVSGVRQRLRHLGLYGWALGRGAAPADAALGDDAHVAAVRSCGS